MLELQDRVDFEKSGEILMSMNNAQLKLPLATIVITNYNYADYIGDALESVSLQTYRPLECIVVDDCSTDNSLEVIHNTIKTLEAKNNGICYSVISTEKNSGQLAAFQQGIKNANGVFINFLDADDILFPEFISVHIQAHLENMAAFTFSEPVEIDDKNQIHCFHSNTGDAYGILRIARGNKSPLTFNELKERVAGHALSQSNESYFSDQNIISRKRTSWTAWLWYPTSTAVFRKSAIIYLAELADIEHWRISADFLLFCYANIIGDSCFIHPSLAAYRRHGKNGFAASSMAGAYNYLPAKSVKLTEEMHNTWLPIALLQLLSLMKETSVDTAVELSQTLIYQQGPSFLIRNWKSVFSNFPLKYNGMEKLKLLLKACIRHFQYERKKDLQCMK